MRKKVLLVSYCAPPLINAESILVWKTVCEMSQHFDVSMITSEIQQDSPVDHQMSLPSDVKVFRKSTCNPKNPFLRKVAGKTIGLIADEQYLWASFGSSGSVDCDLIYSRSHPGASHILAHKLKRKLRKPWLAQFSDPWTRNPYHTNHTRLRKASDSYWERQVIQDADYLIFPTKEIADMYDEAYKSLHIRRKSMVLPHHYIPELYENTIAEPIHLSPTVSFAYFGDFYGLRSPAPFLKALSHIAAEVPELLNHISVSFYGNIESKFAEMVERSPVKIHRRKLTYFESLQYMVMTDVLLLIDAPSESGVNPFLASKLIDYLGAGKRILGITDVKGTCADILRKYGHYVVSPHDTAGIMNAIKDSIAHPKMSMTPPVEFTTKNIVGRLVDVMTELMGR